MATGSYYIVRVGWKCNICGHMTYKDGKIKHRCNEAPHFLSTETICCIPKRKINKVLEFIKFLRY